MRSSSGLNSVNMTGRLTGDPEMSFTEQAVAFTKFRIAVRRYSRKDEDGQKKEVADFFNVIVWNRGNYRLAENCATYLARGDMVGVHGSLEQDDWKTPTGEVKERVVINARHVDFLHIAGDNPARGAPGATRPVPAPIPAPEMKAEPASVSAPPVTAGRGSSDRSASAVPHSAAVEVVGDGTDEGAADGAFGQSAGMVPDDEPF
ncbi:MAG: single-stranded DNA-binding protein [Candidatus Dormibacteria bacterium]